MKLIRLALFGATAFVTGVAVGLLVEWHIGEATFRCPSDRDACRDGD